MPDPALHGNGHACPGCDLRREPRRAAARLDQTAPCNLCGGTGRIARPDTEILADATRWAARHYWPERMRRWQAPAGGAGS